MAVVLDDLATTKSGGSLIQVPAAKLELGGGGSSSGGFVALRRECAGYGWWIVIR